jgi:hypothetical protein
MPASKYVRVIALAPRHDVPRVNALHSYQCLQSEEEWSGVCFYHLCISYGTKKAVVSWFVNVEKFKLYMTLLLFTSHKVFDDFAAVFTAVVD